MLRAKEEQDGIGNVARQNLRAPTLPIAKNSVKHFLIGTTPQAPQKFQRARRRSRASIQQRNFDLPGSKRSVDYRKVSDYKSQERETQSRLQHRKRTSRRVIRSDISVSQREKSFTAKIENLPECDLFRAKRHMFAQSILHTGESKNQSHGPNTQQHQQRQRPVVGKKALATVRRPNMQPHPRPESPEVSKEQGCDSKSAFDAPWQDHSLKRIHQDEKDKDNPADRCPPMHRK